MREREGDDGARREGQREHRLRRGPASARTLRETLERTFAREFEQVQTRAPAWRAQDQPVAGRGSPGAEREENARSRARPCLDLWVNEASPVPRNPGKRVWVQADRHREHGSQGRGSERQEKGTGEIWRGRQRHDSVGERDRETPQGEGLRGGPLP